MINKAEMCRKIACESIETEGLVVYIKNTYMNKYEISVWSPLLEEDEVLILNDV